MREAILINFILKQNTPIRRSDIAEFMNLSESTIRDLIKSINEESQKFGVSIILLKRKGYTVEIFNQEKLENSLKILSNEVDLYNPEARIKILLGYLLQFSDYITINHLAEKTGMSRSTIIRDLEVVEDTLGTYNLQLIKRAHYGVKIDGYEKDLRKAISDYVIHAPIQLGTAKDYHSFRNEMHDEYLRKILFESLIDSPFGISDVAFNSIVDHLNILLFRVTQSNFITNEQITSIEIEEVFFGMANKINTALKKIYNIELPKIEIQYLAAHICTRINTVPEDKAEKMELRSDLTFILSNIDQEFFTYFQDDNELIDALLLHMYPLLKRLYFNIQLKNPIIEDIYVNYTNVFVVSCRFAELIKVKFGFDLTRDEIGYIALHFAAHFEREKNQYLEIIKRIVVVCSTGQGSANLLKLKLKSAFPKANVVTTSQINMPQFENDLPDLFLSTLPLPEEFHSIPVIHIKEFLNEEELQRIKEIIMSHVSEQPIPSPQVQSIKSLFKKDLFSKSSEKNYMNVIKRQANLMIEQGLTPEEFLNLVIERELKMPTIYKNTVAGPHPIKLIGNVDSIGVTILEKPVEWKGRLVQIIFLINLRPGHLFLHKEISKLLLYLIDNKDARERLISCSTHKEFLYEIEKNLK